MTRAPDEEVGDAFEEERDALARLVFVRIGIESATDSERLHLNMLTSIKTNFATLCLTMALSPLAACASSSSSTIAPPPEAAGDTSKAATPLAVSVHAAIVYYESMGQNWERAAMTKARPVAGDPALGRAFLAEIRPFVWRRHLDRIDAT